MNLYVIHSEKGSQCSFSRRDVEWWWQGEKRTSKCSKVLKFWGRVDNRIRCIHKDRDNCKISSPRVLAASSVRIKPSAFELEIGSLTDFYEVLLEIFMDNFESRMNPRFLAESEKGMLR